MPGVPGLETSFDCCGLGKQRDNEAFVKLHRTEGEPVGGFFSQSMHPIPISNQIGRRAAADDNQRERLRTRFNNASETFPEIRQIEQAPAEFVNDDRPGIVHLSDR